MTEAELFQAIKAEALRTTSGPYEFLRKVDDTEAYDWTKTHWFTLMKYADKLKTLPAVGNLPVPPAPPPSSDPLAPYRSILFMAEHPEDAHNASGYYKVAFTADPAYDRYATAAVAVALKTSGHLVYVWYVPTEVSKARADEVAARLGAPVILGQCETAEQFDASVAHGRRAMVGNLGSLRPDQLALVASGERICVVEDYWNCGGGAPDWKNANAGVPGNCVAVYGDGQCTRKPLSEYIATGRFVPHRDSVYGPGMRAEDWAVLT